MSKETPSLSNLAAELLGKSVYVEWPHLKEALVCAVANAKTKFSLIEPLDGYNNDNIKTEELKNGSIDEWNLHKKLIKET